MLSGVMTFLRRPVAWGAVLLSYVGIIAVTAYAAGTAASNSTAVQRESQRANTALEQRFQAADRRISSVNNAANRDLCKVVSNVHVNAKFRARTEHQNLRNAKAYVRTGEDANLVRRVRDTLPIVRQRVRDAEANVRATAVPPTCKRYVRNR